jgi:hypothetical protein
LTVVLHSFGGSFDDPLNLSAIRVVSAPRRAICIPFDRRVDHGSGPYCPRRSGAEPRRARYTPGLPLGSDRASEPADANGYPAAGRTAIEWDGSTSSEYGSTPTASPRRP